MITFIKRFWYRYVLNKHLCEEFTQWKRKKANFERPVKFDDWLINNQAKTIEYTKVWQERQCTICGRTEQQELNF